MKWRGGRRSGNVEDRRGESAGGSRFPFPGGSGGFHLPRGGRRIRVSRGGGIGGIGLIAIVIVVFLLLGGDLGTLLQQGPMEPGTAQREDGTPAPAPRSRADEELADFVSVVLADTEDTWTALFERAGSTYERPKLVLFSGAIRSACGFAQSATGPFYCPLDRKVYIDLQFYSDLKNRFRAPGDFAQAYVIAHEVGHHVQTLLGISDKVRAAQGGVSRGEANAIQVRMELQADCFAGLWAHHADRARGIIETGDVEEALRAASAIGDDRLQRQTQGHVVPDAFTHGTSEQRRRWFRTGLESGSFRACDAFSADRP